MGPVIIIVFGCEEGRLPEPDEALELLPELPEPEFARRLLMLNGTGDDDWELVNFCFNSSLMSTDAVAVAAAMEPAESVFCWSVDGFDEAEFSFGFTALLLVRFAFDFFGLVALEGESVVFGCFCCCCMSVGCCWLSVGSVRFVSWLLALVIVLESLSSSELSSFECGLLFDWIDAGEETEKF